MGQAAAVSALALTVSLVLTRPRIAGRVVVGPALAAAAGVAVMVVAGQLHGQDIAEAARVLWRPLVTISSVMITAAASIHLGVVDRIVAIGLPHAHGSASRLFGMVFLLSALTATVLNNDSAVLVLTPTVVLVIRRLFPDRPALMVPFVLAVFMAAGVAPLVTSNPMNLIVADYAGLDFNGYALRMAPIAIVGSVVTFAVLRHLFREELAAGVGASTPPPPASRGWSRAEVEGLALALGVLGAYPVVSYLGGLVWTVAVSGAIAGIVLCWRHRVMTPRRLLVTAVAWEIPAFLLGVFMLALGLRNAGAVEWLTGIYSQANLGVIGAVSAAGAALINNHSMAVVNLLALEATSGAQDPMFLAALIGGDLGPRLLPTGSLAGLLWFASLERMGVSVPIRTFVRIGTLVTIPSLGVSLGLLALIA